MCILYCNGATPGTMRIARECCCFFFFVPNGTQVRILPSPLRGDRLASARNPFAVRPSGFRQTGPLTGERNPTWRRRSFCVPTATVSFVYASRRKSAISSCVKKKRKNNEKQTGVERAREKESTRIRRHNLRRTLFVISFPVPHLITRRGSVIKL